MDLTLNTESALVSLRPPASTTPRPGASMHVTVVPHSTRSARRTRFAVRGTSAGGRPLADAIVRLAGHQAHTGLHGRASITLTLRHAGRWIVRVTATGYRPARAAIVVHAAMARH
jgi:hypothetical protein